MMMMEIREEKTSVTFHEVAAYFSEEEWKLLHEEQKELYRSVMKEIHQALISLGHNIINRDAILQIKKREDLHIRHPKPSEKRADINEVSSSCSPSVTPDIYLRIQQEETLQNRNLCGSKEVAIGNFPIAGPDATSFLIRTKEEEEPCPIDQHNMVERGTSDVSETREEPLIPPILSLSLEQDEEKCLQKRPDPEEMTPGEEALIPSVFSLSLEQEEGTRLQKRPDPKEMTPDNPVITSVFSLNIKYEEETDLEKESEPAGSTSGYPVAKPAYSDSLKFQEGTRVKEEALTEGDTATGDTIKRKPEDTVKCAKNAAVGTDTPETIKMEVFQSSLNKTHCSSSLWPGSNRELGEKKPAQSESSFSYPTNYNLHQATPNIAILRTYAECESNLRNVGLLSLPPNAPHMWRPYKCTECETYFSLSEDLFRHEQTHTKQTPHQCTECDKSFVLKEHLIAHQKIHAAHRTQEANQIAYINLEGKITSYPHQCTKCEKSFSLRESLNIHLRTHTDAKPFQCTVCEKSFNQKVIFIRHLRTHSGERPYTCSDCGANFTHKLGLLTHQRRRLCKKPYPFPVYTQCFVQLGDRVSLEGIHSGNIKPPSMNTHKPYQCTECGEGFSREVALVRHERSHTPQ